MKKIIVYFSQSGNTKSLVEEIYKKLNYDVVRIEREKPYSSDYHECAYVEAKEEIDKRILPAIKKINVNFNNYDEILLFFPIWWYTIPMPVGTFIKELNGFSGNVMLFANSYTNDKQYMVNSLNDIKELNPSLRIKEGLFNKSIEEHLSILKEDE